jgi:hypothetical protein
MIIYYMLLLLIRPFLLYWAQQPKTPFQQREREDRAKQMQVFFDKVSKPHCHCLCLLR